MSGANLLTRDAETIAKKLQATIKTGRRHDRALIYVGGQLVGQFGIRRGTNVGHDFIPRQIGISMRDALGVARCTLYFDDYVEILRGRG